MPGGGAAEAPAIVYRYSIEVRLRRFEQRLAQQRWLADRDNRLGQRSGRGSVRHRARAV